MDFLSYRETGHIGGPSGKGHIRALDIGGIRLYREISHVCRAAFFFRPFYIWWLSVGPCLGCKQQRGGLIGLGMVQSRFGDECN